MDDTLYWRMAIETTTGPWITIPKASLAAIVEGREHARVIAVALENKVAMLSDENAMLHADARDLTEELET